MFYSFSIAVPLTVQGWIPLQNPCFVNAGPHLQSPKPWPLQIACVLRNETRIAWQPGMWIG